MENLLDQSIPEELGDFLFKKMDEYKAQVNANYRKRVEALEESFEDATQRLFAFSDNLIEEKSEEQRKEFSAKLAARLEEKNAKIEELEDEVESWKDELAERVNTFLSNAKEDARCVVEEEFRVDADELKSQHVLEQVRDLVSSDQSRIVSVEEGKVERLENDIEALKERVAQKTKVNENLKAELHVVKLLENVPDADYEFFAEQLSDVQTISEADEKFERINGAVRRSRSERLEEEFEDFSSKGELYESDDQEYDRITLDESGSTSFISDRMKQLARV